MIDMLKAIGITMVAEGIETEDDLRTWHDLGFDMVQGYFIQRPTADRDDLVRHYELWSARVIATAAGARPMTGSSGIWWMTCLRSPSPPTWLASSSGFG